MCEKNVKSYDDVEYLAEVQARLLAAAVEMLAPGGVLIYCVCSLQHTEGLYQVEALLDRTSEVKRKEITADELFDMPHAITAEGDVMTLPHYNPSDVASGGMDGFYMARLVKTDV